ncbi:hypothetical protein E9549_03960 [Blastococcus sp. MG754426]|uniref:hypothetical protein n=1 Tax=unclassified Blastococcus TaxID=2619396 RepID=UPI001EF11C31|nr:MULTISPECIES: hypothetical protein [unclassified Blastococcus]MCF6506566.1 hypothetical protein [Blastococcus sp. MG754426]MCF6510276.1 hypothetical protein [Blastococcus sp. MG754427]
MCPLPQKPLVGGRGVLLPDLHGQRSQPLEVLVDLLTDVRTWSDEQRGVPTTVVLPGMPIAHSTLQSPEEAAYRAALDHSNLLGTASSSSHRPLR